MQISLFGSWQTVVVIENYDQPESLISQSETNETLTLKNDNTGTLTTPFGDDFFSWETINESNQVEITRELEFPNGITQSVIFIMEIRTDTPDYQEWVLQTSYLNPGSPAPNDGYTLEIWKMSRM